MGKDLIFVVEDELHIRELLTYNLINAGFNAESFEDGESMLERITKVKPALVLLDLMLPGIDGLEVCKRLGADESTHMIPVIMLTAKGEEFDRILGLELGADDYIVKPFSVWEVMARIKAVIRRSNLSAADTQTTTVLSAAGIVIDLDKHTITKNGTPLTMPIKEFDLLNYLILNRGRVLTREMLLDKVWGYDYMGETRTVDVHIRHLRQKVEDDPDNPVLIETVRGVGYKFAEEPE